MVGHPLETLLALLIALMIAALIGAGFWIANERSRESISAAEKALLNRCFGDKAQFERLLLQQLERNPRRTRARAASAAVKSLQRDQ